MFIHGVWGGAGAVDPTTHVKDLYASYSGAWNSGFKGAFTASPIGLTYYGDSAHDCIQGSTGCSIMSVRYVMKAVALKSSGIPNSRCRVGSATNLLGTGGSLLNGDGPLAYAYHVAWWLQNNLATATQLVLVGHSQGGLVAQTVRMLTSATAAQQTTLDALLPTGMKFADGCWPTAAVVGSTKALGPRLQGTVLLDAPSGGIRFLLQASCGLLQGAAPTTPKMSDLIAIARLDAANNCPDQVGSGAAFAAVYKKALSIIKPNDTMQFGASGTSVAMSVTIRIGSVPITITWSIPKASSHAVPLAVPSTTNASYSLGLIGDTQHTNYWKGLCPKTTVCEAYVYNGASGTSKWTNSATSPATFWPWVKTYAQRM